MLELKNISKIYHVADQDFTALDNISIQFRKNEFVSILGQSGSGKTTMLNIIGGLDQYTSGDLLIKGKSTKEFKDRDWDAYRNHSVGFVFQSYNLISHQSILSNVELALTLSGVEKSSRRQRAKDALKKVGLEDHIYKKPNQLSGGQMQRVAIARALINDPEILLADEPTGALDSDTSKVIMDLLKEIANDRLVVMVTHNPELAEKYSNRIVRLKDGKIVDDTNPFDSNLNNEGKLDLNRTRMSFFTALSLSFNNLLTKKARTILTAFAGSIGIIGIALILSLSTGANDYIDKVQEDTLTMYPIAIESETFDLSGLVNTDFEATESKEDKITTQSVTIPMLESVSAFSGTTANNLKNFKEHIEDNQAELNTMANSVDYSYDVHINIYDEIDGEILALNPFNYVEYPGQQNAQMMNQGTSIWEELFGNTELLESQYEVVSGSWPQDFNQVVLFVTGDNQITDLMLYQLGLKNPKDLVKMQEDLANDIDIAIDPVEIDFSEIVGKKYKYIPATSMYKKENDNWIYNENEDDLRNLYNEAIDIEIVGIVRPNEQSAVADNQVKIGYTKELTDYAIDQVNNSEIGSTQLENQDIDVFTNKPFLKQGEEVEPANIEELDPEVRAYVASLPAEQQEEALLQMASQSQASLSDNMAELGLVDVSSPSAINIYPKDFEGKDAIDRFIDDYNANVSDENDEIVYTDIVGLLISSITSIINIISYLLMGFVSISLVVSSIMIGIITYVSVLERTKEIGILKAIGASRKDISRVFNAETIIIGFLSGTLGIGITLILMQIANYIIDRLAGVSNFTKLPIPAIAILVGLSIFLTLIAGLIPSRIASKKDPVEALRSE